MKVIDTFLFSDSFEANCLEIKLNCEAAAIDEWVLIQSPYSFRGDYKGVCAEEVLKEKRFDDFRDRVKVITIEENWFERVCTSHCEKEYFKVEFLSRASCWDYIQNKYQDDTRVIISDVDELIDFSDEARRAKFFDICSRKISKGFQLYQLKYWWDIDNLSFYPKYIPVHTISSLRLGTTSFTHRNNDCQQINDTDVICAFEYAYSFSMDNNFKKCSTFAHDRYTTDSLTTSQILNCWHRDAARGEVLGRDVYDWFETIELNKYNTPSFVLENYDRFKVNTIDPKYASNRINLYGWNNPHPALTHGFLGKNKIAKRCDYYRNQ